MGRVATAVSGIIQAAAQAVMLARGWFGMIAATFNCWEVKGTLFEGELAMATTVRITVLTGPHKNGRFCFRGPTRCTLGRASDCFMQLVGEERDNLLSRHHCQLDIDPPCVLVEDLGSLNGTYLNGRKLAPVERDRMPLATSLMQKISSSAIEDGDIITVGGTSLKIDIVDCPPSGIDRPVWTEGEVEKRDCPISC